MKQTQAWSDARSIVDIGTGDDLIRLLDERAESPAARAGSLGKTEASGGKAPHRQQARKDERHPTDQRLWDFSFPARTDVLTQQVPGSHR